MTPIGETLRRERLRRNLDLREISKELKIAPYLLEAIEAERFERLPGGVFTKSFVRQYARLLGLDGDEMAAEVARAVDPQAELLPGERPGERPDLPPLAGFRAQSTDAWQRVGDGGGVSSWLRSAVAIVAVTLACSAAYMYWERSRAPRAPRTAAVRTEPAPAPPAQPQQSPPPQTAEPQPEQPQTGQAEPAPSAAAPTQPAPQGQTPPSAAGLAERASAAETPAAAAPLSGNAMHIQITADEPVWVRASNNGKLLFSVTLDANQTRTLDAEGAVELRVGNAGGVQIQLNGKPIGAVGPKGQARTVQLTSGGFKIESPARPAVPPAL
jgi:cytoskeleton protein RodZ